jgi:sodium-coupled neutral amino acid transporter 11
MTTYYFPDEPFNPNRHLLFTTVLVVSTMFLALITCDLGAVFELIGATSAAALAYILPPLCYVKLSNSSHVAKIPAYACIFFGTAVMGISLLQAVAKMIRSKLPVVPDSSHHRCRECCILTKSDMVDEGGSHTCGSVM